MLPGVIISHARLFSLRGKQFSLVIVLSKEPADWQSRTHRSTNLLLSIPNSNQAATDQPRREASEGGGLGQFLERACEQGLLHKRIRRDSDTSEGMGVRDVRLISPGGPVPRRLRYGFAHPSPRRLLQRSLHRGYVPPPLPRATLGDSQHSQ